MTRLTRLLAVAAIPPILIVGAARAAAATPRYEITVHTIAAGNWFYPRAGGGPWWLPANDTIDLTCYYGNHRGGDHYQDHVTYTQYYGHVTGHIPDINVNLGGKTPPQIGVPHC